MKKSLLLLCVALLLFAAPVSASFTDDFNRADNDTVGNNWVEEETASATVNITNQQALFVDNDGSLKTALNHSINEGIEWFNWTARKSSSGSNDVFDFRLYSGSTEMIRLRWNDADLDFDLGSSISNSMGTANYYDFAINFDWTANNFDFYLDGSLEANNHAFKASGTPDTVYFNTRDGTSGTTVYLENVTGEDSAIFYDPALSDQTINANSTLYYDINVTSNQSAVTFTDSTDLFDINSTTGVINFTPTYALTENITINATDGTTSLSDTFLLTVNAVSQSECDENNILYINFEDGSGTPSDSCSQQTISSYNGAYSGTVPSFNTSGNGGEYSGDFQGSDRLVIADADNLTPGSGGTDTAFTWSGWAYMHEATGFNFYSKGTQTNREIVIGNRGSDVLKVEFYDGGVTNHIGVDTTGTLTSYEDSWMHLVVTYDGSETDSGFTVYINGQAAATSNAGGGSYSGISNTGGNACIGDGPGCDSGNYADGLIDEVRVYNVELSADQVQDLFNYGTTNYSNDILSVSLNSPADDASRNIGSIPLNYTVTTNQDLINSSLLISNLDSFSFSVSSHETTTLTSDGRWNGRPQIEELSNGNWVMVYRNGSQHVAEVADKLHIRFSDDEGETWTDDDTLLNGEQVSGFPLDSGSYSEKKSKMIVAPNDDLLLFTKRADSGNGHEPPGYYISNDSGASWTEYNITWDELNGYSSNDVIVANDYVVHNDVIYISGRKGVGDDAFIAKSTNNGTSWSIIANLTTDMNEVGIEHVSGSTFVAVGRDGNTGGGDTRLQYWDSSGTVQAATNIGGTIGEIHQPVLKKFSDGYIRMTGRKYYSSTSQTPVYYVTENGTNWYVGYEFDLGNHDSGYGDVQERTNGEVVVQSYVASSSSDSEIYQYVLNDTVPAYGDFSINMTNTTAIIINGSNTFSYDASSYDIGDSFQWKIKSCSSTSCDTSSSRVVNLVHPNSLITRYLSEGTLLDLTIDGTNYAEPSEGWTAGTNKTKNLSSIDSSNDNYLIIKATRLDATINAYLGGNLIGNIPSDSGGDGTYYTYAFKIESNAVDDENSFVLEAPSSNAETTYIDYIGLAPVGNISDGVVPEDRLVVFMLNTTGRADLDSLEGLVYDENGSLSTVNDFSRNTFTDAENTMNLLYAYETPSGNGLYRFNARANYTTVPGAWITKSNVSLTVDSTAPTIDTITTDLDVRVGETVDITVNITEQNPLYVQVSSNDSSFTPFNLSSAGSGSWTGTISYNAPYTHNVTVFAYDDGEKNDSYTFSVDTSNASTTNDGVKAGDDWGSGSGSSSGGGSDYVSVGDSFTNENLKYLVTFNTTTEGTASINDYNITYTLNEQNAVNITISLANGTNLSFDNSTTFFEWTADNWDNANGSDGSPHDFINELRFSLIDVLGVEWENSGVNDIRLFYVNYTGNNTINNISLRIPLRTVFDPDTSSIDFFECTTGIDWNANTCGQYTERTTTLYSENDLTYHWDVYPTQDTNNDSNKDYLYFKLPQVDPDTEYMFKIDLDSANPEISWDGSGSDPGDGDGEGSGGSGGGGGGGSSGGSSQIPGPGSDDDEDGRSFIDRTIGAAWQSLKNAARPAVNKLTSFDITKSENIFLIGFVVLIVLGLLIVNGIGGNKSKIKGRLDG